MKTLRRKSLIALSIACCFAACAFIFFAEAATTIIDDVFADGISTNQNLSGNSLAVYKARSATVRTDAVGSVDFNMSATTGSEAFWAYFTESGSPVTLGVGDAITLSGTFTLTGFGANSQDIRFGLFNSNGSRQTADLTGGQSATVFGDDTGYAAQFFASGTGNPFALYRRDVTTPATTNIFTSFTNAGFTPLTGTGAAARQPLTNGVPYTFTYSVSRTAAAQTLVAVAVTGAGLTDLNYAATETSATPNTSFDWFTFRVNRSATPASNFTDKMTFTRFKVEYTPAPPIITTQPLPVSQTVAAGSNVQFSVAASGNGLSYQWRRNGTPITGNPSATTATLQLTNVLPADAGAYTVVVSNAGGSVTSSAANLTVTTGPVDPPPVINQQPQNTVATIGAPASLSVTASGLNLTYQWFKNGVLISGATGSTLSFAAVQASDTANYYVTVSNGGGTLTSNTVRLTVVSTIAATAFSPTAGAAGLCADTPLSITFNQAPRVGSSGTIKIYKFDGTIIETIDLANAAPTKTIGTNATPFRYFPVIVTGNTAAIYPKQQLPYNQTYYVTIDAGAITDAAGLPFAGFSGSNTFRFTTKNAAPAVGTTELNVAADNSGDFCTVQGAIDFVPVNNTQRSIVTVKSGLYTEIVYVGAQKPLVTVRGESRAQTIVQYANNNNLNGAITGNNRASFGVDAADFSLENITLRNTTPAGGSQAETLRTNGGRTNVNSVNLLSFQDTLLTQRSAFVTNSYIEGDVDFMWGNGATFYQNSELKSLRDGGYYTQIRNPAANGGNVYVNCRFTRGAGVTSGNFLGRIDPDDFPFSQVVLIDSQMDSHIAPAGWLFNNPTNPVTPANYPNIRYWEYRSTDLSGAPVDCSQRHPISRSTCNNPLTVNEAAFFRNAENVTGFAPQPKLTATVALSNLTQTFDGTARAVTVTTNPAGLNVTVTYNGSTTVPMIAGTYTVIATVNEANFQGSTTGTLVVNRGVMTIALGNLTQVFDGVPKFVSVTTNPPFGSVRITYNGSVTPPTAIGNYRVAATSSDPNLEGTATAVLNIRSTIKSFLEAEGAGSYSIGGRGGDVYHVTNLNDSGAGSLRNGIQTANAPRTIVFDVAGTINLNSQLNINKSYLTIAGQSAPGDGITIAGWTTLVTNAQHVIVRYLRFRTGDIRCAGGMEGDAFSVDESFDVMVDHVSASWSIDESLSVTDSDRVTVQWSTITESLNQSCHPEGRHGYGSLIRYGSGRISFHHNLYAHHFNRNPRVGDNITLDFVNNVIYDWGTDASYSGGAEEGITKINYVNNYLIAGPNTPASKRNRIFSGGSVNTLIYQDGNFLDGNVNGVRDGVNNGWTPFVGLYTRQSVPLDPGAQPQDVKKAEKLDNKQDGKSRESFIDINYDTAGTALTRVLSKVGQSLTRDAVDVRIINNVNNETGAFINSQNEVGGFPMLNTAPAPADDDGDGMPNAYEIARGFNPNNPNDGRTVANNGYTNLENYLNVTRTNAVVFASISGRVLRADGRGTKARVTLTNTTTGESIVVTSNSVNGSYIFENVAAGQTYLVSVRAKNLTFNAPTQAVNLFENVSGLNFTAQN